MPLVVRGYETQVRIFMILVVLFLVTANLVTVTFLNRSQALLAEEAGARVLAGTVAMAREVEGEGFLRAVLDAQPGAVARAAERLSHLCGVNGASVGEILDRDGRIIASSQTWKVGTVEPGGGLDAGSWIGVRAGRAALVPAGGEGDLTVALVPLPRVAGSEEPLVFRVGYALEAAGTITRQIRLLTWAQGIGGTVVLVMVLLFTRYVLRPYRALRAAAESVEPAASPMRDADDPAFLVASFRGVVEKMRGLEGELDRMKFSVSSSGARESLLASLSSGVLILDASGRVAVLNPAGEAILGLGSGGIAGRPAREVFEGSPDFVALLDDAVSRGRGRSREVVSHRLPSGRAVHLGVTVSSPPGGGGGALCLFSDLTEIRGVQARVLLKENLARLGELSAGIAHEFRNSLATILGYARLAAKEAEPGAESADAIVREVQSMGRIVDAFLRYAAPARLQKSECDLREILTEIAREVVREGEEVAVTVEGGPIDRLLADETQLRQALHNLIRNAVEAAISAEPPREVRVAVGAEGGAVTIEVTDSGPGFSPEVLPRLFTPFVTTKERGTGLGMALAQKVIVSHDGSIEAGNLFTGGAKVTVILPLG